MGGSRPTDVPWLDPPPLNLETARRRLRDLGLLDHHHITPHGRAAFELGTEPRLAHTLVRAVALGPDHRARSQPHVVLLRFSGRQRAGRSARDRPSQRC